jgi:methionine-S-sulfoxide reductase
MMKHALLTLLFSVFFISEADAEDKNVPIVPTQAYELATLAGGCFWCIQPPYDKLIGQGVIETRVGYSGGETKNPTYESVSRGKTGHAESLQIKFDPTKITYEKILEIFWENIDPTDAYGQFVDRGSQYRPAIFYHDDQQKKIALESRKKLDESKKYSKPISVEVTRYKSFYDAEEYHQKYYEQSPIRYKLYKKGSGREAYLKSDKK